MATMHYACGHPRSPANATPRKQTGRKPLDRCKVCYNAYMAEWMRQKRASQRPERKGV